MEQYFANRELLSIGDINTGLTENKIFANERPDETWNKEHVIIRNCTFAKIGFKKSKFKLCDLSFCIFIDCYFKHTEFHQTKLTGCVFINCNFDDSQFFKCDFQYAKFTDCYIPFDNIRSNLPIEQENLCADLCQNLAIQCSKAGDDINYKKYFFEKKKANERHQFRKVFHRSKSYYSKYNFFERLEAAVLWIYSKIDCYIWGYGERLINFIFNSILIMCLFALIYSRRFTILNPNIEVSLKLFDYIKLSVYSFFSFNISQLEGLIYPQTAMNIEGIIGLLIFGLFLAGMFRNLTKR